MTSIENIRKKFIPGLPNYVLPKTMPAYAIIKDKPKSFEMINVSIPKIGHDEALICVMASGINYNTIWTIDGNPVS